MIDFLFNSIALPVCVDRNQIEEILCTLFYHNQGKV